MPYKNIDELPERVKEPLPRRAQEIFLNAYNNAWEQYSNPKERKGDASQEETAFKVAWSAVKQSYKKENGNWVKK